MQNFILFLNNNYLLIKAFHVISMVAWMAALLYLPRLFVYHTTVKKNSEASEMLKIMEYRLQKYIMTPAMILTIFFGILLIKIDGIINWSESLSSNLRPIIVDDIIMTVSDKGYLYISQWVDTKVRPEIVCTFFFNI